MFSSKSWLASKVNPKPSVIAVGEYNKELVDVLDETYVGVKQYLINYEGPKWVSAADVNIIDRYWSR